MKEPAKVHENAINYNIEAVNKNASPKPANGYWQSNNKEQHAVHNIPSFGSCSWSTRESFRRFKNIRLFYFKRRNNRCNSSRQIYQKYYYCYCVNKSCSQLDKKLAYAGFFQLDIWKYNKSSIMQSYIKTETFCKWYSLAAWLPQQIIIQSTNRIAIQKSKKDRWQS